MNKVHLCKLPVFHVKNIKRTEILLNHLLSFVPLIREGRTSEIKYSLKVTSIKNKETLERFITLLKQGKISKKFIEHIKRFKIDKEEKILYYNDVVADLGIFSELLLVFRTLEDKDWTILYRSDNPYSLGYVATRMVATEAGREFSDVIDLKEVFAL